MRYLSALCLAVSALLTAPDAANAAVRNSHYTCSPAWPEGNRLVIDWPSRHVEFPNGSEMDMSDLKPATGFSIGEADTEISGKDASRITVHEGGEPDRVCVPR